MTKTLTDEDRAIYEWQMWEKGFGEAGQEKLKNTTALVSRIGGLGSPVCYSLTAAGIGKLILAHGGNVKHSDLNRQILMTHDWLDKPRVESAERRLKELNPNIEIETVHSNITDDNVEELVARADIVFDCAPLFQERFAMNRACVNQNKPLIDSAMYSMEGVVIPIIPGRTACLQCIYSEFPSEWQREFPVFAAVSALAANIAVMEGIKIITGLGESIAGHMLYYDTRSMDFKKLKTTRDPSCPICG